jgi:thiamine biosynthesis lipoprotein
LKLYRVAFAAMGSPCELELFAQSAAVAQRVAARAVADVRRLEARYSRYREDSLLSQINRVAAAGGSIAVDAETESLLRYADEAHRASDGLFDVTSGVLRRAWRFDRGELPDPDRLEPLLRKVGWDKVEWAPPVLAFPVSGMEIDLGGVVKEYAADRAAALCRGAGLAHGFVNLGGDVRVIGPRLDGAPWRIGIRHPRRPDALVRTLSLREGALASSGDYERCVVVDGVRYGHILDPRTGWPVRRMASVTVHADLCVVAGSASTIAMLKDADGPAWLAALGLPHFWMDVDGRSGGPLAPEAASEPSASRDPSPCPSP